MSGELLEDEEGLRRVSTTGIEDPGRPMVVSRTWHVIGGFFSVDIVDWFVGVGAMAARWEESAERRWVAGESIDLRSWKGQVGIFKKDFGTGVRSYGIVMCVVEASGAEKCGCVEIEPRIDC